MLSVALTDLTYRNSKEVGALSPYKSLPVGTKIIPLCSLTAIPLYIESIGEVHEEQVTVQGKAIVFPCYKVCSCSLLS